MITYQEALDKMEWLKKYWYHKNAFEDTEHLPFKIYINDEGLNVETIIDSSSWFNDIIDSKMSNEEFIESGLTGFDYIKKIQVSKRHWEIDYDKYPDECWEDIGKYDISVWKIDRKVTSDKKEIVVI